MPLTVAQIENDIVTSQTVTTTTNLPDFSDNTSTGAIFMLNITAASGTTPTLDLKLQAKSAKQNIYIDVPGAAFAQKTTTGTDMLVVAPGVTVAANKSVAAALPMVMRWVATITGTTPSFTFSIVSIGA